MGSIDGYVFTTNMLVLPAPTSYIQGRIQDFVPGGGGGGVRWHNVPQRRRRVNVWRGGGQWPPLTRI